MVHVRDTLNRDILRLAVPALGALIAEPLFLQVLCNLLRNAADQEAGRGHIAKHKEWFEGVETDLRKIMAGTDDQAQFDKLVALVRRMGQLIAEAERLLPLSIAETRALAARR